MSPTTPSRPEVAPREGADPAPLPPAPPAVRPPPALRAAVILSFLATLGWAVARVNEEVRSRREFRVALHRVRIPEPPDWLPREQAEALGLAVASRETVSIRAEGLPDALAARLAGDPRVARVVSSRRLHPNAVEIVAELRRPVALVEAAGGLHAVDREGRLLPGDYAARPLPRIRAGPVVLPRPGSPFEGPVARGASVAAVLPRDLAEDLGLTVIEVSVEGEGEAIRLLRDRADARAPVVVEWGRPPASPQAALDPDPAVKVAHLRLAAERFPDLRGLRTVRLGFDSLVVVPL